MLTIKERGPLGTVLKIPNYVVKTIYWEQYFQKISENYNIETQKIGIAVNEMRMHGNIELLIEQSNIMRVVNNTEYGATSIIEGTMPLKFKMGMKNEAIELTQLGYLPKPLDKYYKVFWYKDNIYNVYMSLKDKCNKNVSSMELSL